MHGYIQVLLTPALNEPVNPTVPKTYIQRLHDVPRDTKASGSPQRTRVWGVLVMPSDNFYQKMSDLLGDKETYNLVPIAEVKMNRRTLCKTPNKFSEGPK